MGVFILAYWLLWAAGYLFKPDSPCLDTLAAATTNTKRYIEKLWATEAAQSVELLK
jgi:hypothetical protein